MIKIMSLAGLILILSTVTGKSAFISPDSVAGGYKKCTTRQWNSTSDDKKPKYTNIIVSEAEYDLFGNIVKEVTKYENGTPKQSISYSYDDDWNIDEISLFDNQGILSYQQIFTRSKDTVNVKSVSFENGKELKPLEYSYIIRHLPQYKHSTMNGMGGDRMYHTDYIGMNRDKQEISINEYLPVDYQMIIKNKSTLYENKYDSLGRIIETIKTGLDGKKETSYNKYDSLGRLFETSVLQPDGSKKVTVSYRYEENGSKTRRERNTWNAKNTLILTRYDNKGRVFEREALDSNGVQISIVSRKFDDNNRIIEVIIHKLEESPSELQKPVFDKFRKLRKDIANGKRTFEYDKFGNITKETWYSPDNQIIQTIDNIYSK